MRSLKGTPNFGRMKNALTLAAFFTVLAVSLASPAEAARRINHYACGASFSVPLFLGVGY